VTCNEKLYYITSIILCVYFKFIKFLYAKCSNVYWSTGCVTFIAQTFFFSSLFQNLRGLYLSCDIPFSLNACHWLLPYLVLMMMVTVQVTHSQPSYFLAVLYKMPTLILIYVCFWWFSYFWIGSYFSPWWFLIRIILGE